MESNNVSLELEQMRSQFGDFKTMLKKQNIVNEKIMRRAMAKDYSQMRREIVFVIIMAIVAAPFMWWMMPLLGSPLWFVIATIVFFFISILASCFSLYRYASDDLLSGNLTAVAEKMICYKRFGENWLKFSIPFLIVWLALFIYFVSGLTDDFGHGILMGGIVGAIVGGVFGGRYYIKSNKRIARMLKQIDEVKNVAAEQ